MLLQQPMADCQSTRSKGKTRPVEAELTSLPPIAKRVKVGNVNKIVGEIKVTAVSLIQPQDGPPWYQAVFCASLPKSKAVKSKTSKQVWSGRQCDVVTSTLHHKILEKASEAEVERGMLLSDITMVSGLPFWKACLSFENQVLQLELEAIKSSVNISKGHKSRVQTMKNKPWFSGEDFQNRQLKHLAKERVLAELEIATDKDLLNASSVLASIASPGFRRMKILSSTLFYWKQRGNVF